MADNLYVHAAEIFTNALAKKAHVKNLVYASEYPNKRKLFALVCQGLKHKNILHEIATSLNILNNETYALRQNMPLLQLLLYDKIFGKGICGSRRFKNVMRKYRDKINNHCELLMKEKGIDDVKELLTCDNASVLTLPRYIRVNTLKVRTKAVCSIFKENGYKRIHRKGKTYEEFLNAIEFMNSGEFLRDLHIPTLLVFPAGSEFHEHPLFLSGKIVLQEKASCFPAFVLSPTEGSTVIDCCAAPGNKTTHLAALMNNVGKIYAIERDARRMETLKDFITKTGSEIVETIWEDFMMLDPADPRFKDVEFILVDPSCTGSGIISRMDNVLDSNPTTSDRLQKLYFIQRNLLRHALSFPGVKRVVYSTCSVFPEENEQVIDTIFERFQKEYCLEEIMPDFPHRGLEGYQCSKYCLRFTSEIDKTNGFFVACFVRRALPIVESNHEQL
ncbi:28S rRNA (cytosine-C(5))-methyltransferase-like [Octopus vulgaris]|uniref:28S rRNA (Cytosine-C(5))-methyltransferase-like n=1 Tax=Octopus vulgaris TaxID=6645 RepID=A0AA36FB71_OCTVU|nr:28S rRNA (cytosine-C(5))-methyltransferase-like [Octopus vulgaris]